MRRRITLLLLGFFPVAGYLACVGDNPVITGDAGPDGASSDAGSSDVVTADVAPPVNCPTGCLPKAPTGWIGPSAVYDGPSATKPAACPTTNYTQKELSAYQGLDAGPAQCACGNPTFAGSLCTASLAVYSASDCSGMGTLLGSIGGAACQNPQVTGYVTISTPSLVDAGTCTYPSPTSTVPDASFTAEDMSCGFAQATACPAASSCVSTPVPDQPFTRLCIHQDGDTQCPSADYSKRFVAYRDLTDTRACSACTGTASGGSCGASWGTFNSQINCGSALNHPYTAPSSCVSVGSTSWVGANFGVSNTACTASGGAPQGTATAANPVTFCCNN